MSTKIRTPEAAAPLDPRALAAGLVTVTLWGSAFVAIRDAGHTLSPGALTLGRLLVSSAILGIAAAVWRETPPWPAAVGGALCVAGVALARR